MSMPQITPKQTIVFLHGFLGTPEDWDPIISHLKNEYDCYALNLYELYPSNKTVKETLNSEEKKAKLKDIQEKGLEDFANNIYKHLEEKNIFSFHLVGYSMGGRLAIELSQKIKPLSLFLLSSHFGLKDQEIKRKRHEQNLLWINILRTTNFSKFLEKWYSQPIFSHLNINKLIQNRLKQEKNKGILEKMLLELSLGKQDYYLDKIPRNTHFFYGKNDIKYKKLYEENISKSMRHEISEAYHMLHLENPNKVAELLIYFLEK